MREKIMENNHIIGYYEFDGLNNKIIRNAHGDMLATYFPKQDITKDYHCREIGRGDITMEVLKEDMKK